VLLKLPKDNVNYASKHRARAHMCTHKHGHPHKEAHTQTHTHTLGKAMAVKQANM